MVEIDLARCDAPATAVAFRSGTSVLAIACADGLVRLRDVVERRDLISWPAHRAAVWAVAFSPDGTLLATASEDMTVTQWDARDGRKLRSFEAKGQVRCVAFGPDGATIAAGGDDKRVRVWNAATGETIHELNGPTSSVRCLAFSPDGATLFAGTDRTNRVLSGEPGQVRAWDAATGAERFVVAGHLNGVTGLACSAEGDRLLTTGGDGSLKVWDASGQELMTLPGHLRPATSLALAPRALATAAADGTLIWWRGGE